MRSAWKKYGLGSLILASGMLVGLTLATDVTEAKVTGVCSDCHTMHNSQNGATEKVIGSTTVLNTLQPALVKASCIGCHGMGGSEKIRTMSGGSVIPQVLHSGGGTTGNLTNGGDLAAGNFGYITNVKGTLGSEAYLDSKGHNVKDLSDPDDVLSFAPGIMPKSGHDLRITDTNLTCAGNIGCHGNRIPGQIGLSGAHHQNVDGLCPDADTVANSYRFLLGVKGLENTVSKWQNVDSSNHNEYFGATTPMTADCAYSCHLPGGVQPLNNTISGFCATCHGQFHAQSETGAATPFKRHPTDVILNVHGTTSEYASYTTYSTEAPIARTTLPAPDISKVAPASDIVTCLSCHGAHATDYPDMLRWDYSEMQAHSGDINTGCFVCHTTKDSL